MPQSRREQIVREILARIATAVSPIVVLRQPTTAIPREKTPALVVTVESDTPVKRATTAWSAISLCGLPVLHAIRSTVMPWQTILSAGRTPH